MVEHHLLIHQGHHQTMATAAIAMAATRHHLRMVTLHLSTHRHTMAMGLLQAIRRRLGTVMVRHHLDIQVMAIHLHRAGPHHHMVIGHHRPDLDLEPMVVVFTGTSPGVDRHGGTASTLAASSLASRMMTNSKWPSESSVATAPT